MGPGELLVLLLLLLGKKRDAASRTKLLPGPVVPARNGSKPFAEHWAERATALMRRAKSGAKWASAMAKRLGSDAAGAAAARWIGIESGGNPLAASSLNERGLAQVMKTSLKELGLTEADYADMANPKTTNERHADLAAKTILGCMLVTANRNAPDPGWGPIVSLPGQKMTLNGIGIGKLRHGLPLLVKELAEQKHLRSTIPLTIKSALGQIPVDSGSELSRLSPQRFQPSERLQSFAKGKHALTGDPVKDLLLRFLVSAAVVAHAEDAAAMGLAFSEQKGTV